MIDTRAEDSDESRWQNYLKTGHAFSFDFVRHRLRNLAKQAKAEIKNNQIN